MFKKIILIAAIAVCLAAILMIAMTCKNVPHSRLRKFIDAPRPVPVRFL